jgi:hypothetical protein
MTAPDPGVLFTGETTTDPADTISVELTADELPAPKSISTSLPLMVSGRSAGPDRAGRPVASTHVTRAREAHPPFIGVSTPPAVAEELRPEDEAIATG